MEVRPMIAIPKKKRRRKVTAKHQELFVTTMLPTITRIARQNFSHLDPEAKEEATAEVIAAAFIMFVGLVRDGRESLAFPSVLAMYGVRRVRIGRPAATPMNVRDVSSLYCQLKKGVSLERLDQYDRNEGGWMEILVEDKHATPADIAATRIDFSDWLRTLSRRTRKIAEVLSTGETTGNVAKRFHLSAARISQLRRQLYEAWLEFTGEAAGPATASGAAA
jgi:hypothetical protein